MPPADLAPWGFPPSLPPSHSTGGSLSVEEPGGQRVLVFPGEGVVLALARESHPAGVVAVSEPKTCWAPSCPGSSVSLQEGLAAGTAQSCSLPPGPSLSACPRAFRGSWVLPCFPGLCLSGSRPCAWLSLAAGCSLCGMAARAWVFLAPLHLFQAKVWAGISLPGERSSFRRVSGRAFPTFRASLSPLPLSVQTPLEWSRSSAQGHGVLGSGVSSSLCATP